MWTNNRLGEKMKRISKLNTRREIMKAWIIDAHKENLDKPTCPSCRDILFSDYPIEFYTCENNECKVIGIRPD